ncbi:unnamed protein product [Leptosia nina]|uniref:Uncharacterized protein n=1 Tax=Leptosia nina TaxID=320188 RepID=A0AAV1JLL1_9NEOP
MNCTKCNESLTDSVSCAQCSGAYITCVWGFGKQYKKMGPEKRAAWRCITCRAVVSTDNTTNAEILRELKNLKSEFNSFKLDLDTVKRDTHDTVMQCGRVPSKSGENLHNIVSDICAVTGFRLEPTDVDTVHRVRQFATHDGQAPAPGHVVRFTRRRRKDELLAAARARAR